MFKFNNLLGIILLLLLTPIFVSAIEVRPEDYGAIADDNLDDSAAIQAAANAIFAKGGGKILFPSGTLNIHNLIRLVPPGYAGAELKLQGNRGSVLEISVGSTNMAFYAGNLNIFSLEDLIITGKNVSQDSSDFYDAKYVIYSNYVLQTNITRCQFYGLAVPDDAAVIYLGNTDTRISDSQIDGSLALYPGGSVILAENTRGLTVSRTTFIDYANFRGVFLSKSSALAGSWIKVRGNLPTSATGQRRVLIEDSRFDEGAATAIDIQDMPWVHIIGINVNVNNTSVGRAIFLKNVNYAKIEQSWFGYAPSQRPALDFEDVGGAEVTSLNFGGGVYFLKQYPNMKVGINYCPQCVALDPSPRPLETTVKKK